MLALQRSMLTARRGERLVPLREHSVARKLSPIAFRPLIDIVHRLASPDLCCPRLDDGPLQMRNVSRRAEHMHCFR